MTRAPIKVHFRRFYPRFDPHQFWIPLIEQASGATTRLSSLTEADLVITSVFESRREMWKRRMESRLGGPVLPAPPIRTRSTAKSIWVSGENIRPPVEGYDLTFSFDLDPFGSRNLYLPLILTELDWFYQLRTEEARDFNPRSGMTRMRPGELVVRRETETRNRSKFACAFVGNAEPVRMRAIAALQRVGQIDVFGAAVGRPLASKADVASDYRFMLCFENDLYPGYVTEKPLEAYQCGCIPLWRGIDAGNLMNPLSLVDEYEFATLEDFVDRVAALDSSETEQQVMLSQPFFREQPTLDAVIHSLRRLVCS